jgi:IrrE N-terminal-like domain
MISAANQTSRLRMAKQTAEALLRDEGMVALPIDPFAVAASRDITVRAKPDTAEGVSGMLLRHGDVFGILYATNIPSEGFQRFSVSHELGHYFLDGHIDRILPKDGVHTSRAGFVSADPHELEADHFAAGLLMPAGAFRSAVRSRAPGLAAVEALAAMCRTSLPATAIRYAELVEDAVAIVVSTGATIDYCFLSETIKSLPQLTWLRRGMPVPRETATSRLNACPDRIAAADRTEAEIDIMDWLGGAHSSAALEEVIGLGQYGKTLTVLTCASIRDKTSRDEDDSDEELIRRWTPRFR